VKKKDESNGNIDKMNLSETKMKNLNERKRNALSKSTSSTKPATGEGKSTTKSLLSQESKLSQHVDAWFTPAVPIEKVDRIAAQKIGNSCDSEFATTLRFGVEKKKASRLRSYSTEKLTQNERPQATPPSIAVYQHLPTLKDGNGTAEDPPILYDEEWSPLANSHSARDNPKQKGNNEKHPSVLYDDEWSPFAPSSSANVNSQQRQQESNGSKPLENLPIQYDDELSPLAHSNSARMNSLPTQQENSGSKRTENPPILHDDVQTPFVQSNSANVNSHPRQRESNESRLTENPPILYDDEWSPLAHSDSDRDKPCPRDLETYGNTPDNQLTDHGKPTCVDLVHKNHRNVTITFDEMNYTNRNNDTNESFNIPREIRCHSPGRSKKENCQDGASTDSGLQPKQMIEYPRSFEVRNTKDAANDATNASQDKNENCITKVQKLDSIGNAESGTPDSFSTLSDSGSSRGVPRDVRASELNSSEVKSVTVAVHAHEIKTISSLNIDSKPLDRPKGFDRNKSCSSIGKRDVFEKRVDSSVILARKDTTSGYYTKRNGIYGSGIKFNIVDDKRRLLSAESELSSRTASTYAAHDGNATNVYTKEANARNSPVESADAKATSKFGSSRKLDEKKGTECSSEKSILHNSEDSVDNRSHAPGTHDGQAQAITQPNFLHADNLTTQTSSRNSSPAKACSSPSSAGFSGFIDGDGSEAETSIESPLLPTKFEKSDSDRSPQPEDTDRSMKPSVDPTAFENENDPYWSPNVEDGIDQMGTITEFNSISNTPRKQNRMSWRVLNPPDPICSLQRLDKLILRRKRKDLQAKRPKRRGRARRKQNSVKRRRKSKSRGRF
jgi:hypothetical protein